MSPKKAKKPKGEPTPAVKVKATEVDVSRIRVPVANPARAEYDDFAIDKYTRMLVEYREELQQCRNSTEKEPLPEFPLGRIKIKRIEEDDQGHEFETLDGSHTLISAKRARIEELPVEICEGSEEDLLILAIQGNAGHGLPYTRKDIRRNILSLRKLKPKPSIYRIAEILGCSKSHVANILNDKGDQEDQKSTNGQTERPVKEFGRNRFTKDLLDRLEKHAGHFTDFDVIALAKIAGRIAMLLGKKQPDLVDTYCDAVRNVVSQDSMDQIDYDTDMLFLSDEAIAAREAETDAEDEPEAEDVSQDEA